MLPKLKVEIIPGKPPHLSVSQPMDCSRAKEYLSWEPQFTMEQAFEDYTQELKRDSGVGH